jgi:hypothetical protein
MFIRFIKNLVVMCVLFSVGCATTNNTQRVEKPDSDLFKTLDDFVDENSYLVMSYTIGNVIGDYTYEVQMESLKSFDIWSWSGTSEELNCMVTVKSNDEVVAQIYSTDERDKARIVSNGFRGKKNVVVVFLDEPSTQELITAYNKMMNGIE